MKKKIIISIVAVVLASLMIVGLAACNNGWNGKLELDKDGNFKILQLTDTQFSQNGRITSESKILLDKMIEEANPDLIVITGDVISGEHWLGFYPSYTENAQDLITFCGEIRDYFDSKKIPWTLSFGNHDGLATRSNLLGDIPEFDEKNKEPILALPEGEEGGKYYTIRKSMLTEYAKGTYFVGGLDSQSANYKCFNNESEMTYTNFSFPIYNKDGSYAYNIYVLDCYPIAGDYPALFQDQIDFYNSESARLKQANGGQVVKSLLFHHESLPMFIDMKYEYDNNTGKTKVLEGDFGDKAFGGPKENSAIEEAMIANKDIIGVFVGHDHLNTLAGIYEYTENTNILLAYGRMSAIADYLYVGLTRDNFIRGARVIELNATGDINTYEMLATPTDINANPYTDFTISTKNAINTADYK